MKFLLLIFLFFPLVSYCEIGDKESFLTAWEKRQSSSELVEVFQKVSDKTYHIKFATLPYEGELHLLIYEVEDIEYLPKNSSFTKTGYVEIDIPNEMSNLMEKYSRTYFKWAENNNLYFDSESQSWVSQKDYSSSVRAAGPSTSDKVFIAVFEYWSYALIVIILYFFWSTVVNTKRTKRAIKVQEDMLVKSLSISEESISIQKSAIQQSAELHKKTNETLLSILNEVKHRKM